MYKISKTVRTTHGQDGAVVLDIREGQMFNLNLVGSRILAGFERGASENEIADEISRDFGVGREIAFVDVQEFLEVLKQHHLVEPNQPPAVS